MNLFEG